MFPWERAAEEDRDEAGACDGACSSLHPSRVPAGLGILRPHGLEVTQAYIFSPFTPWLQSIPQENIKSGQAGLSVSQAMIFPWFAI